MAFTSPLGAEYPPQLPDQPDLESGTCVHNRHRPAGTSESQSSTLSGGLSNHQNHQEKNPHLDEYKS